jgi:ATP-dependent Clp protease adaptor protein ClpS
VKKSRPIAESNRELTPVAEMDFATEQELVQETEAEVEPPYRVLIHNDDVTPMDFVVVILMRIFEKDALAAEHIMFTAHLKGLAYVATFPRSEAQKRVGKAHFAAQLEGYPLLFSIEPES